MPHRLASVALASALTVQAVPAPEQSAPVVVAIAAPAGVDVEGVQWIEVSAPTVGSLIAAVARPEGPGPFPAVVVLHGSHGFARQYVRIARDLARAGFIAVAACWFSGGVGEGAQFITPLACPGAPPISRPPNATAHATVDALLSATRRLPDVRGDRMALFGHSRGGGAALQYLVAGGRAQALVLHSTGYPAELAAQLPKIDVPVLVLHGTNEGPADGGADVHRVEMARAFEAALRRAGTRVEASYYEGGRHSDIFRNPAQYEHEVNACAGFLSRVLRRASEVEAKSLIPPGVRP